MPNQLKRALAFFVVASVIALAGAAHAQTFQGLDSAKKQTKKKKARSTPVDRSGAPFAAGGPVIAIPPAARDGSVDNASYDVLTAAMKEQVGDRLVDPVATVNAIKKDAVAARFTTPAGRARLAEMLGGGVLVAFTVTAEQLDAQVFASGTSTASSSKANGALGKPPKLTTQLAKAVLTEAFTKAGDVMNETSMGLDLTGAQTEEEVPENDLPDAVVEKKKVEPEAPVVFSAPRVIAMVGAGATFRQFQTGPSNIAVPQAPPAMMTMAFGAQIFPLRFFERTADRAFSDLSIEGYYRRSLVRGTIDSGGSTTSCPANDDELVGRIGYRHRFHPMFPRVGLAVGLTSESMSVECGFPTLSTSYQATELQLRVLQPFLSERLTLELAGGPRMLFSTRARGFSTGAYSFEGWVTFRPIPVLAIRGGVRLTGTQLTTWPDGVSVSDMRTMAALEVGATL